MTLRNEKRRDGNQLLCVDLRKCSLLDGCNSRVINCFLLPDQYKPFDLHNSLNLDFDIESVLARLLVVVVFLNKSDLDANYITNTSYFHQIAGK